MVGIRIEAGGQAMIEREGFGIDYERYALNRLFKKMVRKHPIHQVLEIPAKGEKAMPSLYSVAFGEAGCKVTLVNAEEKSKPTWENLGLSVAYRHCPDLNHTALANEAYDLVWNFQYLAKCRHKDALLAEMVRLSRRFIMYIAVNRYNPGFYSHRLAHRLFQIPWNHGNINFMNPHYVSKYFSNKNLKIVKTGVVDVPPFPDSLGIRDTRLHKKHMHLNTLEWESRTIQWMQSGKYPLLIRLLYLFEMIPLPFRVKLLAAHLFYVLAEK